MTNWSYDDQRKFLSKTRRDRKLTQELLNRQTSPGQKQGDKDDRERSKKSLCSS